MLYFVSPQVALEDQTTYAMASSCFTVAFMTKAAISAAKALGFDIKQEQLEVVVKFAMGRDVFAVLPTGFGKTLCYQCLPGVFNQICFDGKEHCSIKVVISPLIAIMKDQVYVTTSFL